MLATHHLRITPEEVNGRPLQRCTGIVLEGGTLAIATAGLGFPRLWQFAAEAALNGFLAGYRASHSQGRARIEEATLSARDGLARQCGRLTERMLPDAVLVAAALEGTFLHVVTAGPGRAYLHRGDQPKRLTPRSDDQEGLLRARPAHASETLVAGDLVLMGTLSAFSARAIGKVAATLDHDALAKTDALTESLVEPAEAAGVGAVALALRVH